MAVYDYSEILENLSQEGFHGIIPVYNGGDIETGFKLVLPLSTLDTVGMSFGIVLYADGFTNNLLSIEGLKLADSEDGVLIDTNAHLIQGITINDSGYTTTTNVYNNYIVLGDFFKIMPQTEWVLTEMGREGIPQLICLGSPLSTNIDYNNVSISYDTLYI